jgi:glycosyltransferase involved in cell wall biosynthesis
MFGMYPFPQKDDFIEYVLNPSRERLVELYQQSRIYLSPSLAEGWQLPPMEAMACGCAVVATRVGCIPVLEEDGNLLGVAPGDRDGLLHRVESLVLDPGLLRETAEKGLRTMKAFGWEKKSREFERALLQKA